MSNTKDFGIEYDIVDIYSVLYVCGYSYVVRYSRYSDTLFVAVLEFEQNCRKKILLINFTPILHVHGVS